MSRGRCRYCTPTGGEDAVFLGSTSVRGAAMCFRLKMRIRRPVSLAFMHWLGLVEDASDGPLRRITHRSSGHVCLLLLSSHVHSELHANSHSCAPSRSCSHSHSCSHSATESITWPRSSQSIRLFVSPTHRGLNSPTQTKMSLGCRAARAASSGADCQGVHGGGSKAAHSDSCGSSMGSASGVAVGHWKHGDSRFGRPSWTSFLKTPWPRMTRPTSDEAAKPSRNVAVTGAWHAHGHPSK